MRQTKSFFKSIRLSFKQSVRLRLTLYFVLAILPLIAISLYSIWQSQNILEKQAGERTRAAMASSLTYIDQFMTGVYQLSVLISNDLEMNVLLQQEGNETQRIIGAQMMLKKLKNYIMAERFISDVWVLDAELGMVVSVNDGGKRIDFQSRDWYKKTINGLGSSLLYINRKGGKVSDINSDEHDPLNRPNTITVARTMGSNSFTPSKHIVGITTDLDTLVGFSKELLRDKNTRLYLTGSDQLIVSTNNASAIPYDLPDYDTAYLSREDSELQQTMFVTKVRSDQTGWSMVLAQPESNLTEQSKLLRRFTYLVIVISCLLAIGISWIVYIGISSPLSNLLTGMRELARGNLNVRLSHARIDEFGSLTDSFNLMAEKQKQYISDIFEHQVDKTRTELKFLQSQINPHFLYNTLDSIHACAVNYDADEICEMVLSLSSFFRLSLNKGRESFTLEETVEHLNYYIRIQELRFTDHFSCYFDIPDNCKELYVLKLILQPLVENAIIHGLEKSPPGGKLIISAERTAEQLKLMVYNSGRLIEKDQLSRIQHELAQITTSYLEKYKPSPDYFGMLNVLCRLKLYYGEGAELRIDSNETTRTAVTLLLPLESCLENMPLK